MMSYENMFSPLNPFDTVSYLLALKVWGDYASNLLSTGLTKVSQFLLANLGICFSLIDEDKSHRIPLKHHRAKHLRGIPPPSACRIQGGAA